jgi:hypothetical protein
MSCSQNRRYDVVVTSEAAIVPIPFMSDILLGERKRSSGKVTPFAYVLF